MLSLGICEDCVTLLSPSYHYVRPWFPREPFPNSKWGVRKCVASLPPFPIPTLLDWGGVIHWQEFVRLHCPLFLSGLITGFESTLSLSVFTDPSLFVRISTNLWKRGSVPFPFETFLLIVCAASLPRLSDVHTVLKGKKEKT
jgi:hypothetical protein